MKLDELIKELIKKNINFSIETIEYGVSVRLKKKIIITGKEYVVQDITPLYELEKSKHVDIFSDKMRCLIDLLERNLFLKNTKGKI